MPSRAPLAGELSFNGGRALPARGGKGEAPWLTLLVETSPVVMLTGLLSGLFGGPIGLPLVAVVKYPSSATPGRVVFSFTASPDLLSTSDPRLLPLLLLRMLSAMLFALGALSLPLAVAGTLSMLPSWPPMPSFTL